MTEDPEFDTDAIAQQLYRALVCLGNAPVGDPTHRANGPIGEDVVDLAVILSIAVDDIIAAADQDRGQLAESSKYYARSGMNIPQLLSVLQARHQLSESVLTKIEGGPLMAGLHNASHAVSQLLLAAVIAESPDCDTADPAIITALTGCLDQAGARLDLAKEDVDFMSERGEL